ncbi:MAG: aminodeoxychorismate lyase [Candidatus Thiodiazotropha sp. (ex Dulcina madagascariensis)]|nr:aminodeoxychorismate lyase [Candidatus Thiodiazotropha sp. (ex Dulcina madagascariensis)]
MLIDGIPGDQVPLSDRGLQYGDGLFETLAVTDGRPGLWQRHMARLQAGEQVLGFPVSDKQRLWEEARALCAACERGVLKIILTRGSGGRGYQPPAVASPRRILSLHPWPDYPGMWYKQGIRLRICETRVSGNRRLAGLKHLNRLEQVLARNEWRDQSIAEGLMLDERGKVISGTQSNLFIIQGDVLLTPDLSRAGVAGVVRELVLERARQLGIVTQITELALADLKLADALFITNSVMGLCPVAELDDRHYAVEGIPAVLRQSVQDALAIAD